MRQLELAGRQEVVPFDVQDVLGRRQVEVPDVDVFQTQGRVERPVPRQQPADADAPAEPVFGPLVVEAVVVKAAHAEVVVGLQEERILPADEVTADLVAGHRFQAEALAAAAERLAVDDIGPRTRRTEDVEVVFLNGELANQTCIAVHTDAEHQSSRAAFGDVDVDVDVTRLAGARAAEGVAVRIALRGDSAEVVLGNLLSVGTDALTTGHILRRLGPHHHQVFVTQREDRFRIDRVDRALANGFLTRRSGAHRNRLVDHACQRPGSRSRLDAGELRCGTTLDSRLGRNRRRSGDSGILLFCRTRRDLNVDAIRGRFGPEGGRSRTLVHPRRRLDLFQECIERRFIRQALTESDRPLPAI